MQNGSNSRKDVSLSFVVPLKDEAPTLGQLFSGIAEHASEITSEWEVVFIDDGSSDGSWDVIRRLASENPRHVKAIKFRRNMGKADALAAGWAECKGDFVFTMDADLQDDPVEIPRFLEKMEEGWDIVSGWKRRRHDPWHKVLPSRVFNFVLSKVNKVSLHDHNCGFKCYRREVVRSIPMYGEMHRMVPSLAAMHGYRTTEIPVQHHPRLHGHSKYGFKRFLRGFLDMWTVNYLQNFRRRPFHFLGSAALGMVALGFLLALLLLSLPLPLKLAEELDPAPTILVVGGLMTAFLGLIAEWNVHEHAGSSKPKAIADRVSASGGHLFSGSERNGFLRHGEAATTPLVLLIEPDRTRRELHASHLREAGWSVISASSYHEAQSHLGGGVQVLLLNTPDGNGLEKLRFFASQVGLPVTRG
jgi:glycosyltransferase involved in cell wall biosynthesis